MSARGDCASDWRGERAGQDVAATRPQTVPRLGYFDVDLLTARSATLIALLTRRCGISPAATAWYTVDVLTRSIAASSRTETHRTDPASIAPACTKDVPSGRETAANRCKKGLLRSRVFPAFPATCESERPQPSTVSQLSHRRPGVRVPYTPPLHEAGILKGVPALVFWQPLFGSGLAPHAPRSRTSSAMAPFPSSLSPSSTPRRSASPLFWLAFHCPSRRVMVSSTPTIPSSRPSR